MTRLTIKPGFEVNGAPSRSRCRLSIEADLTFGQLKLKALKELGWEQLLEPKDMTLSLNKRDSVGLDEELVSNSVVCSGDTLWMLADGEHPNVTSVSKDSKRTRNAAQQSSATTSEGHTVGGAHPVDKMDVCFDKEKTGSDAKTETGGPVLHQLVSMLQKACIESGLETLQSGNMEPRNTDVSANSSVYKTGFVIPESCFLPQNSSCNDSPKEASIQFLCTSLGEHVMICSFTQMHGNDEDITTSSGASTSIKISSFFRNTSAGHEISNAKQLMTELKSKACAPSMLSAAHVLGRSLRLAMTSLPDEIVTQVLTKLEVRELVSVCMTCRSLNTLASSDSIWTLLYTSTFGRDVAFGYSAAPSVKELFKIEWEKSKKQQVFDRPFFVDRPYLLPPPQPTLPFPFPGMHGITGDDADRFPFAPQTFDPPSIFGRQRHPQRGFPSHAWRFQ